MPNAFTRDIYCATYDTGMTKAVEQAPRSGLGRNVESPEAQIKTQS